MEYYAPIVKHSTTFRLKRHPKWQGILYLCCYLYFRYREINDKIITAFRYLVKKHKDASVLSAKARATEEIDLIKKLSLRVRCLISSLMGVLMTTSLLVMFAKKSICTYIEG